MKKFKILYCIAFLAILVIPLCFTDFSGGKVSELEKRELAAFPQIFDDNGDVNIKEIGKIDDWISDNVGFRDLCVESYTNLMVNTLGVSSSDKVMAGKDGWYFYTPDNNISIGLGKYLLDKSTLTSIAEKQQMISDYYKDKGMNYVLVITPSKASVYTEYILGGTEPVYTMSDQLRDYLQNNTDVNIVTVKDAIVKSKDEGKLFLKTDTHWTQQGAYCAYREILEQFKTLGIVDQTESPVSVDFGSNKSELTGEFGLMLGNYDLLGPEEFSEATFNCGASQITSGKKYNNLAEIQKQVNPYYPAVYLHNESQDDNKLVIYGDSQWELFRNMPWYFSENFSDVVSMRADSPNELIDAYSEANTVLFACSERFIDTKLNSNIPDYINNYFEQSKVIDHTLCLPVHSLENSPNGLWIDYTNGTAQTTERAITLDLANADNIHVTGWAGDLINGTALGGLFVKIGENIIQCEYGIQDDIVAEVYQNEQLRYTGFSVDIPADYFTPDIKQLEFIEISLDGSYRYENIPYSVSYANATQGQTWNDISDVLLLPVHSLENSPNGLWIDYTNGTAQTTERAITLDLANADNIHVTGWAGDLINGTALGGLFVKIGENIIQCEYGIQDDIVAEVYQNEQLRYTGFSVDIPADYFTPDIKQLEFIEISLDGSYRYENIPYSVSYANATQGQTWNDISDVLSLPVHSLENSPNGLWIDYTNGTAQTTERAITLDLANADNIHVTGWAGDLINGTALGGLFVKIGENIIQCEYGIQDDIVAEVYQNEQLRYTGFSVDIPADYFTPDIKQLEFIEISLDGSYRYENIIYNAEITGFPARNGWIAALMIALIVVLFCLALLYLKKTSGGEMFQKLRQNQFLFSELVKRDFTLRYKRTTLGMLWSMISPLVNLLIMWLVFERLLGNNIDHYVIYLFAGQLIFNYFNEATTMGMTSLLDNSNIFSKVNVPKYLFLFSRNIASLINFGLTLIIFFIFVAIDGIAFSFSFLSLIYPILCLIILNIGVGMLLSALFIFFRDMRYLWGLMSQLIMWLSVIFYSIDTMPVKMQKVFMLNPIYLCIKYFRSVVIDNTIPDLSFHLWMAFYSMGIFAIGCLIYKKKNHEFMYYV